MLLTQDPVSPAPSICQFSNEVQEPMDEEDNPASTFAWLEHVDHVKCVCVRLCLCLCLCVRQY